MLDVMFDVPGEKRGIGEAGKCIPARHVNPGRGPFLAVATSRQPSATRIPSRAGITLRFFIVISFTPVMPADRLLGTLLRSLQVYTDQQDTPR